jgi:putative transposase
LELLTQGIHLVSTDEMSGIQALERLHPALPMRPKQVERIEFEYIRHGTQTLLANWHIAKGQLINPTIGATRTEEDFKNHIARTLDTDPEAGWIFIVDQLNIHQSESLVRLVAERCRIVTDLGVKQKTGILLFVENSKSFLI